MGYQAESGLLRGGVEEEEKKIEPRSSATRTALVRVAGATLCFALGVVVDRALAPRGSSLELDSRAPPQRASSPDGESVIAFAGGAAANEVLTYSDAHAAEWRSVVEDADAWEPVETAEEAKSMYPHIVLSLIDDQGLADMGYSNGGLDELEACTPFMDILADDGIKLDKYYTQQLCTPSRSALLTGYYPIHTGMQHDVIQPESLFGLPLGHALFPAFLKSAGGYATHIIGKWHLGHYKSEYLPQNRGFDHFYGYLSDQLWYYNHKSPHACLNSKCFFDMQHNGHNAVDSIGVYSTFLFTDAVEQVLNTTFGDTPLFVYLSWQNVHAPLDPPPASYYTSEHLELLKSIADPHRRTFAAITIILDVAVRKTVGHLKKFGFYDNTIFVVASDNGGCSGSGGYNGAQRGGKQYLYEGGIHVNAFVHSPLIPLRSRGAKFQGLFHVSDWLPTLVTGAIKADPAHLPADLDGVDQWKALLAAGVQGETEQQQQQQQQQQRAYPRDEILHNIDLWALEVEQSDDDMTLLTTPIQAIRVGHMKLVMGQDPSEYFSPVTAACPTGLGYCTPSYESTDDCRYTYGDVVYLFNITEDPTETTNLAETHPHIVAQLTAKLTKYHDTMVDPAYHYTDLQAAYTAWIKYNDNFVGPFDDDVELGYASGNATQHREVEAQFPAR